MTDPHHRVGFGAVGATNLLNAWRITHKLNKVLEIVLGIGILPKKNLLSVRVRLCRTHQVLHDCCADSVDLRESTDARQVLSEDHVLLPVEAQPHQCSLCTFQAAAWPLPKTELQRHPNRAHGDQSEEKLFCQQQRGSVHPRCNPLAERHVRRHARKGLLAQGLVRAHHMAREAHGSLLPKKRDHGSAVCPCLMDHAEGKLIGRSSARELGLAN
mmetsp:Transcript_38452/g.91855  ORF Transcript_38452/g.91855 Transcript_38452/m.91855 type:complete len:214 (-) Transcript_38452:3288-3929(-)